MADRGEKTSEKGFLARTASITSKRAKRAGEKVYLIPSTLLRVEKDYDIWFYGRNILTFWLASRRTENFCGVTWV